MSPDHYTAPRPRLRGTLHAVTFFVAIPGVVLLILAANSALARVAAAIYGASVLLGFGTSAAYHRLARSVRARQIMQRLDHSAIFLLICGTYVPLCLVVLPRQWGIPLLAIAGSCTVLGVVLKLVAFERTRKFSYALYPITGWVAVLSFPAMMDHLPATTMALIVAGGIAYTVGIPVLAVKRPDPWPKVFGYHEIWHVFTVVAAALHFAAVTQIVAA